MSKKLGECCDVLKLALGRRRESDRVGLMIETMYSPRGGSTREAIVVRFHKSKNRKAEYADTTYALVGYCPFCGTKLPTAQKAGAS